MSALDILSCQRAIIGSDGMKLDVLIESVKIWSVLDTTTDYQNVANVSKALLTTDCIIIAKFNKQDLVNFPEHIDRYVDNLGKTPEVVLLQSPLDTDEDNLNVLQQLKYRFPTSAIGVSDFDIPRLTYLIEHHCKPQIISLEYSPFYQPDKLINFCRQHDILMTGYGCLAKGEAIKCSLIMKLAEKYKTSAYSILLAWSYSKTITPIYSTNNPHHLMIDSVILKYQDIRDIDSLDKGPAGSMHDA